jgi:hypothetical protein
MFSFINFAKDIRIISCLFVKFVLYMAGFLGEGILLFCLFWPQRVLGMEKYSYIVPFLD